MIYTGFHAIEEYLASMDAGDAEGTLYYSKKSQRIEKIVDMARSIHFPVKKVDSSGITRILKGVEHRGIVLEVKKKSSLYNNLDSFLEGEKKENLLVLILDEITDPHNLGAVLRSGAQFGADIVVVPSRNSVKKTDIVSRASAGALAHISVVIETNLVRAMEKLKKENFWIYGAQMGGEPVWGTDFSGRIALVLGSEGRGMRSLVEKKCDFLVSVPTEGKVDSLNISVAAGIILYEIYRQKNAG